MQKKSIEEEIRKSYLEYAMSVIVNRALPDARDGLKPVQRRIIYAMNELSLAHNKPYKKSARIVGETMGKYHPHGDNALYEAMARMAQPFSLRYPLVDGQGNFGSIDGDEPAAMRYTEARLSEISGEIIEDIEKNTVPTRLNFDGTLSEPEYFPSKVPQLLLNGTSGIAVGMATNMLPHNLREVCEAIKFQIDNPECSLNDLMKFVKGPDFPGGAKIFYSSTMMDGYEGGRGKITCQADLDLEKEKRIIITSIPYAVNKSSLVEKIAGLARDEVISGITDIRDESDRSGIRVVLKIRDESTKQLIVNQLFQHTELESTISINNLVLLDSKPITMGLKSLIGTFISHRLEIILKRSQYDLENNLKREHILSGIYKALGDIDRVIDSIRKAKDAESARKAIINLLDVSEDQANAVLDTRLQRLTSMEMDKLSAEIEKLKTEILRLKKIVGSEQERKDILKGEMDYLIAKYGDERRTKIVYRELTRRAEEELIPNDDCLVILSEKGFLKRVLLDEYRSQRRGGKGVSITAWKDDPPRSVIGIQSHDSVLFFTNLGRVMRKKAYEIDRRSRTANGMIGNAILPLGESEVVKQVMRNPENKDSSVMIVTRSGTIKRIASETLLGMRDSGFRIITLKDDDEVVAVEEVVDGNMIFALSSSGRGVLFSPQNVRIMGRAARGVRAMRLGKGEYVMNSFSVAPGQKILSISESGIGKRTSVEDFTEHKRGGKGNLVFRRTEKTGGIAGCVPVSEDDEIIIVSNGQKSIRIKASEIRVQSRVSSGVRLINLDGEDMVIQVSKL